MKVSFDFDGTLDKVSVQEYAKLLVDLGVKVWITTQRYKNKNYYSPELCRRFGIINLDEQFDYLFEVAEQCGISKNKIIFCDMKSKWPFIKEQGFMWHLDDDLYQLREIRKNTNTIGVSILSSNWKHECNKFLKL